MTSAEGYSNFTLTDLNQLPVCVHRFEPAHAHATALLLHGSMEDSRIFFSRSGRGLAPFLQQAGFRVLCPDFPGRGASHPPVSPGNLFDQEALIHGTLPTVIAKAQDLAQNKPLFLISHSWGGVIWLAYAAHYGGKPFSGAVHFATKRRIGIFSIKRLFMVDLMYSVVGELLCQAKGYLPARRWKMGSENEQMNLYRQTRKWVYSRQWKSPDGSADYRQLLRQTALPPSLFLTGAGDDVLGHPRDVQRLSDETSNTDSTVWVCGTHTGFRHNYGHINLLTHPDAPTDVFPRVVDWINQVNT